MKGISKYDLRNWVVKGLIVLIGVLAALFVNEMRDNAARNEAAQAGKARLFREVSQNLGELKDLQQDMTNRLRKLRILRDSLPGGIALAQLFSRFDGHRSPDLSKAAWERLSKSELADRIDPDLLEESFHLYETNDAFDQLDGEIDRLIYSALFYIPERTSTALAISERIMQQQLSWAAEAIPKYEQFLSRAK